MTTEENTKTRLEDYQAKLAYHSEACDKYTQEHGHKNSEYIRIHTNLKYYYQGAVDALS